MKAIIPVAGVGTRLKPLTNNIPKVLINVAGKPMLFHLIDELERTIVGATRPDMTFVFDLDPVVGLNRAKAQGKGKEDRYERMGLAFHQRLREGFLEIAKQNPQRCRVINAADSVETVSQEIWKQVNG